MISDEFVARAALAVSIAGFLLLFLAQQAPAKKTITEAQSTAKNELISITARVAWAKQAEKSVLFELNDGNKITAIFSNPREEQIALIKKNAFLTAIGKVAGKKGKKQFIVKEVKAVD